MNNTALSIVKTLQEKGYDAYFAGGCVRDMILNIPHDDIDIATNALPEKIEELFQKTFAIGKHFGVILVQENSHNFEIATFRSDQGKSNGRKPQYVTFTNAKEDAMRRDFTINGIFYDPIQKTFLDFVHGQYDIDHKIIQFIGHPQKRIQEDYLRILRAIRFKNKLQFSYHTETKKALHALGGEISQISPYRIQQELSKILAHSSRHTALREIFDFQIFINIIPELWDMQNTIQPKDHHAEGNVLTHSLNALQTLPEKKNIEVYLATLFHDLGKAYTLTTQNKHLRYPHHEEVGAIHAKKILNRLKFPKKIVHKVSWIIHHLSIFENFFEMKLSTRLHYYDHAFFEDMLSVYKADVQGCSPSGEENILSHKKALSQIHLIEENFQYSHNTKILPSYKKEFFSGKEIMQIANIPPGKKVGEIQKTLRDLQIEGTLNTKEEAKSYIKTI